MWRVVLLLAACNHQGLPQQNGAADLAVVGDLAVACVASPVMVSGAIPHGFFQGSHGWAWYESAECAERAHLMVRSDDIATRDGVFVDVRFPDQPQLGENAVEVVLSWGEPPVIGFGTATLTRYQSLTSAAEPHLEGTFFVDDNGLQLKGEFSVRHCPALDEFCV
jgi:hypothetical protein